MWIGCDGCPIQGSARAAAYCHTCVVPTFVELPARRNTSPPQPDVPSAGAPVPPTAGRVRAPGLADGAGASGSAGAGVSTRAGAGVSARAGASAGARAGASAGAGAGAEGQSGDGGFAETIPLDVVERAAVTALATAGLITAHAAASARAQLERPRRRAAG